MSTLVPWEEALEGDLSRLSPLPRRELPVEQAVGHALAEAVVSQEAMPPFDNSAMDGFAVRAQDVSTAAAETPVTLPLGDNVPAGAVPHGGLQAGHAVRIMTGALVPPGADAVVPVEHTDAWDPQAGRIRREARSAITVYQGIQAGTHIRKAGESVRPGDTLLTPGEVLEGPALGLLLSVGIRLVNVYSLPCVAVLSTGDELVPWSETPGPGHIRDSNRAGLLAILGRLGLPTVDLGLVRDDPQALERLIRESLGSFDYLVTSGGVSVGDRDFTRDVLHSLGSVTARKVAMKPGKPQVVGTIEGKPVFGLPGNPVSSLVVFELFVLPALRTLAGHARPLPIRITAGLTEAVRHAPGRTEFVRVALEPRDGAWTATPTGPQGSGILTSMTRSNGYAIIPLGAGDLSAGTPVECIPMATRF